MKTLFIPASVPIDINEKAISSFKLPQNIAIAYSIQYKQTAEQIRQILSQSHQITAFTQVLGCSKPLFPSQTEAVLLVSSGKFHAIPLASGLNIPIYLLEAGHLKLISKGDIDSFNKKKKASSMRYLNAEKVGIVVSTKPGQENLKQALMFKRDSKKKSYLFICNNINIKEFENFNINSWINTACPRLDFDSSIINLKDIV